MACYAYCCVLPRILSRCWVSCSLRVPLPNRRYLPKTIITIPSVETLHAAYLGALDLDPKGLVSESDWSVKNRSEARAVSGAANPSLPGPTV